MCQMATGVRKSSQLRTSKLLHCNDLRSLDGPAPSLHFVSLVTRHSLALRDADVRPHHTHIYVWRIVVPDYDLEGSMAKKKNQVPVDEPMGIVISRGAEQDLAPTALAFVWGPADIEMPELVAA